MTRDMQASSNSGFIGLTRLPDKKNNPILTRPDNNIGLSASGQTNRQVLLTRPDKILSGSGRVNPTLLTPLVTTNQSYKIVGNAYIVTPFFLEKISSNIKIFYLFLAVTINFEYVCSSA
jgi:hypothetical protein